MNKGEKVVGYNEAKIIADGNALEIVWYTGNGMGKGIGCYDAGSKRIKVFAVSSGGTVYDVTVFKKDGKWQENGSGSNPDGSRFEEKNVLTLSDDGNTISWSGTGAVIGGEKMDPMQDVWRRVGK